MPRIDRTDLRCGVLAAVREENPGWRGIRIEYRKTNSDFNNWMVDRDAI